VSYAHIVGNSTGGAIGQTLAIEQPQRTAPTKSAPVEVSVGRINALLALDRRAGLPWIKAPRAESGARSKSYCVMKFKRSCFPLDGGRLGWGCQEGENWLF